jgi:outer membrane protein OmpA-like peptidoglycan-associated protein
MSLLRCIVLFCAVFAISTTLHAQSRSPYAGKSFWGVELGLTGSSLSGANNFYYSYSYPYLDDPSVPLAESMPFRDLGSGLGFHIGGVLDFRLSDMFGLVGKLNFHTNNTGATEDEQFNCVSVDGSTSELVTRTRNYSATLNYLTLDLLLRIQFMEDGLYGLAGIGSSSLVGNNFSGYDQVDAGSVDCQFLSLPSRTMLPTPVRRIDIPSNTIDDYYNTNREAFKVGIGTFIPISNDMVLTPELVASIPLTPLFNSSTEDIYKANNVTTPKLYAVTLSVALKFPFGGGPSSDVARSETTYGDASSSSSSSTTSGMVHLRGKVTDANGKPVNANITVTDLGTDQVVRTGKTDDGNYDFEVKSPGKYSVTADAEGYLFGSAYFEVDKEGRILKGKHDITLSPATGRTRLLVFFDFDKDDLQPESFPELSRAVSLMKSNPKMQVEIAGYTDAKGSDAYNIDLSQRRATSVRDYLVKHGIEKNRITAKGYGKEQPIASNDTDEGRAENRRVEFVVIKR